MIGRTFYHTYLLALIDGTGSGRGDSCEEVKQSILGCRRYSILEHLALTTGLGVWVAMLSLGRRDT
jgi:hypothetical protein